MLNMAQFFVEEFNIDKLTVIWGNNTKSMKHNINFKYRK